MPVLAEVEARDPDQLPRIAGALLGHTLAAGAVVALASAALAAVAIVALSDAPVLALELVAAMAACVVATAVRAFYVELFNARGRFAAHPVASGLGVGLTLALIAAGAGRWASWSSRSPSSQGSSSRSGCSPRSRSRRSGCGSRPASERPEPVRRIFRLVRLEVTGSVITRIKPVLDQAMCRLAGVVGGGTLLLYAAGVAQLPSVHPAGGSFARCS